MKKLCLIFIFLLTGCTYEFQLKENITEIKYNNIEIIDEDYKKIKKLINENEFNLNKINEPLTNTLIIKTKKNLYKFNLSNNYIEYNNHFSKNNNLIKYLENINQKYKNNNFYTIKYENDYPLNENTHNILLDNTNEFIVIKPLEKIKSFKINLAEFNGSDYDDIDLLYSEDTIDKQIVIRKNLDKDIIRISFKNSYNYEISIIVSKDDEIRFQTTYKESA